MLGHPPPSACFVMSLHRGDRAVPDTDPLVAHLGRPDEKFVVQDAAVTMACSAGA